MEKVIKYTSSGRQLTGILRSGFSNTCVIFCHGFMGDKDENTLFSSLAETLSNHDIGSFRFDFTGCGESEKEALGIQKMDEDLQATRSFLNKIGFKRVFLLGHSLGCVPILRSEDPSSHNILLSPYFKPDNRRIALLEEEVGDNESIEMKNRFDVKHTISQSFLEEMKAVDLHNELSEKSSNTTVFLGNSDEIMPEDYYEDILDMKTELSDVVSLDTGHFYNTNRKPLYDSVVSMIEE